MSGPVAVAAPPPAVDTAIPVPRGDKPDRAYKQSVRCIENSAQQVDLKGAPWGQDRLQFDDLGKFATGKGVTVAVIDTGVRPHPWLPNLKGGGDFVAPHNGLEDCDGHGTLVAGIIAARTPEDTGFRGIAPDATILSIRQSSANYEFEDADRSKKPAGTLKTLAQAIVRAVDQGADVINMSINQCRTAGPITPDEKVLQRALHYAVVEHDVVVVASAGNTQEDGCPDATNGPDPNNPTHIVTPPWFTDYVLSVGAMNRTGDPATFTMQGPWVSVSAPGTEITSLNPAGDGLANKRKSTDGKPADIQGTSFAAPYVAGLAALIKERFRDEKLTARQIMERIKLTASHPAAPGGHDNLVGHGMVNPVGALTAMIPAEQGVPPEESVDVRMQMPPAVPKDWTPMQVALIGAGGGLLLLLLTLFVVHTVRRNQPGGAEDRGRS
ncbi:type VII secretion system ESX-3 serine protease mycosin MycP3 [Actinokineospora soli]